MHLRPIAVLLALIANASWADPAPYVTPTMSASAITMYVNTGGSDNNTCFQPQRACRLVSGAIAKLPDVINHAVIIYVAPGTYTENPVLKDKTFGTGGSIEFRSNSAVTITGTFTQQNLRGPSNGAVFFTKVTPTSIVADRQFVSPTTTGH
jgi:hypothetical protein